MNTTPEGAFPARAGMNRNYMIRDQFILGVPRSRGDEPAHDVTLPTHTLRSPLARG